MKIRIKGNTIRFRLGRSEVASFGNHGYIEESTRFPGGQLFAYRLEKNPEIHQPFASFEGNRITLFVPEAIALDWTGSEAVGFDHRIRLENGEELYLLVEKDFACLDHTTEDQRDNYPNPNRVC